MKLVDCVRVDHFRGFEAYWEVGYGEETAINGKWVKAPGMALFKRFKEVFGDSLSNNVIAEDLGIITKEVVELRDSFALPGMKIFEFAPFNAGEYTDDDGNVKPNYTHPYLPDNYLENSIAYPGTHDNDLILGWFDENPDYLKGDIMRYLGANTREEVNFKIIERLLHSKAKSTIYLMQDVLCLGTDCRMNKPGTCGSHNWSWRATSEMLEDRKGCFDILRDFTKKAGR